MPTAATVAAVDPEIAPNTVAVPTTVMGSAPRTPPTMDPTQLISRTDTPPRLIISPAKMKNGTASSANLVTLPNIC